MLTDALTVLPDVLADVLAVLLRVFTGALTVLPDALPDTLPDVVTVLLDVRMPVPRRGLPSAGPVNRWSRLVLGRPLTDWLPLAGLPRDFGGSRHKARHD